MDPKQTPKLDPKLQEAFDRVMGTPSPTIGTSSPQQTPMNPVQPTPMPLKPAMPAIPQPTQPINPIQSTVPSAPHLPGLPVTPSITMSPSHSPISTVPTITPQPSVVTHLPAMPTPAATQPQQTPMMPLKPAMPTMPAIKQPSVIPQPMTPPIPQAMQHPMPPQIHPSQQPGMQTMHATAPALAASPAVHSMEAPTHGFVAPKKKTAISPVILIAGGVVFLLAYTVFWLKFFNVPIPFISQ